jgi:predicted amidophosphoribosyltransferase
LICGSCGAQSSSTAKFCGECGTRLTEATRSAEYKQPTGSAEYKQPTTPRWSSLTRRCRSRNDPLMISRWATPDTRCAWR